mmetsp:Transcript_30084/g.65635  ORF Transcript_30084/g.65635 Transcript_30084/m.65635 type:complete len:208 (+) Transcript_30084:102-725(+)
MHQKGARLFKTKFCKYHKERRCKNGALCEYAHSAAEVRPLPNFRKTQFCLAFAQGRCSSGSNCRYVHDEEESGTTESTKAGTTESTSVGASSSGGFEGAAPSISQPLRYPQYVHPQHYPVDRESLDPVAPYDIPMSESPYMMTADRPDSHVIPRAGLLPWPHIAGAKPDLQQVEDGQMDGDAWKEHPSFPSQLASCRHPTVIVKFSV